MEKNKIDDNGLKQGYWEYYYPDGNLLFYKGSYLNDNMNGLWEFYHPNGNLHMKGSYKDGSKEGIWEHYVNGILIKELWGDGSLIFKMLYKDNILIKVLLEV